MTSHIDRRGFLATAIAGSAATIAGCSVPVRTDSATTASRSSPTHTVPGAVGVEPLVENLGPTVDIVFVPDRDRRYIATQKGYIYVHDGDGVRDEPLIDLTGDVEVFNEAGLLGMALHPAFADNRRLFVRYSSPPRPGTPDNYTHTFVLSEFIVDAAGTGVEPDSETPILEIPEPHWVHNSGDVTFGPDGLLYVPTGDGGNHGDYGPGHVEDWYDRNPGGNSQDVTENLLGSILRIDVDRSERIRGERRPYGIPDDNPLVGRAGFDEQYAWGLRNPWRASFDGDRYFVGDVGQDYREEINLIEKGGNYGWNVREGTGCFNPADMDTPLESCPDSTPDDVRGGEPLLDPIIEYPNEEPTAGTVNGLAVVGGHVYRGSELPGLVGQYVFGDFKPNGRLFLGLAPSGSNQQQWETGIVEVAGEAADRFAPLRSIGQDHDGELYLVGGGGVYQLGPIA